MENHSPAPASRDRLSRVLNLRRRLVRSQVHLSGHIPNLGHMECPVLLSRQVNLTSSPRPRPSRIMGLAPPMIDHPVRLQKMRLALHLR